MHNFVACNPGKILFGKQTIQHLGKEAALLGKKVLLVSGKGSVLRNNVYQACMSSLLANDIAIVEFPGVQSNPTVIKVHEAIKLARVEQVDMICGVGGGSVLDSAKAIAAGCCVEHDVWKFFTGKKSLRSALPIICIPTMAASGSETNAGMVLTNEQSRQKCGFANRHLFPSVSILDPETTYSVSPFYTACGTVDILSHLLEIFCSIDTKSLPLQCNILKGIAGTLISTCNQAIAEPENYVARANLMWAANLALHTIVLSGTGKLAFPVHLIEHSLSALFDIPHGAGLASLLPGWIEYNLKKSCEMTEKIHEFLLALLPDSSQCRGNIQSLAEYFVVWMKGAGLPVNLKDLGLNKKDIMDIRTNALPQAKIWRMMSVSAEMIDEVLNYCLG